MRRKSPQGKLTVSEVRRETLADTLARIAVDGAIAEAVADDQPRGARNPHLDAKFADRIDRERKRAAFGPINRKRGLKSAS